MVRPKISPDPGDRRVMTGEAWNSLCDALRRASRLILSEGVPDSPRDRAEGFRYLTRFLAAGIVSCIANDDPDHPVFGRMIDYTMPWGLDNPDCIYLYAPLRGGAIYRVSGNRGSARNIDIQVNYGHFAQGDISSWGTISSLDGFQLETAEDGVFELYIGGERRPVNWLPSRDDAQFLLVRQYFSDWERERPADLLIERADAIYPVPPARSDQIADQIEKLERWIEKGGTLWESMSRGFLSMEPNSLIVHNPENAAAHSGMRGLCYAIGNFSCQPDEAVIVEFAPPRCRYWGVALANYYWECIEYATHQCSLNDVQASLEPDGRFRGVIAHVDPGIANWLDPAGNTRGTITVRFLDASPSPEIALRHIPLKELPRALPRGTPRVDQEERADALARRRRGVLKRFRQ